MHLLRVHVVVVIKVEQGTVTVVKKVISLFAGTEVWEALADVNGTTLVDVIAEDAWLVTWELETDAVSKVTTEFVDTVVSYVVHLSKVQLVVLTNVVQGTVTVVYVISSADDVVLEGVKDSFEKDGVKEDLVSLGGSEHNVDVVSNVTIEYVATVVS